MYAPAPTKATYAYMGLAPVDESRPDIDRLLKDYPKKTRGGIMG